MDQLNWFFKQRVAALEMQDGFQKAEAADENLLIDLFTGGFLLSAVTVVEDAPQSTSVSVGAIVAYDTLGQRVTEAAQLFSFAGDDDPALVTPARLYVKFKRDESDPRVDGLNNALNFKLDEGAELQRDLGTPGGALPAVRVDESVQLATVNIPAAAGVITNADIDTSVQNLESGFPVTRLSGTLSSIALGYMGEVKVVTTGAAEPTDTIDVERAVAVNGGASPDVLMSVKNAPLDLAVVGPGGRDTAAPLIDAAWYIYLIGDSTQANADDVMASIDPGPGFAGFGPSFANAPGYDRFRLVGVIIRFGGSIIPFRQIGERFFYDNIIKTAVFPFAADPHVGGGPGVGSGFIALVLSPFVPVVAERVWLAMHLLTTAAVVPIYNFRSKGGPTQIATDFTNRWSGGSGPNATQRSSESHMELHVGAGLDVEWERQETASTSTLEINVAGFHVDLKHE